MGEGTIQDTRVMTSRLHDRPAAPAPVRLAVCHVVSGDLWAGAEAQVATLASYLVDRPDVSLSVVVLNEGRLAEQLRRLGVDVTVVDEQRTGAVRIVRSLARFFRDRHVEIVHTHRYKESVFGTIAAKLAGVPHVIRTVHGVTELLTGWAGAKVRAYEALDRLILWCFADGIIAVSGRMADAKHHRISRSSAVRTTRTRDDVRRALGIGAHEIVIGTAGRLTPVKGQATLLRAARLMLRRKRSLRFVVAGDGPLRNHLLACARRLRVDPHCLFVGHRTDIHDVIAAMDVFVLPSLDEGVPMVLLEAMALGTPVVASAVGGIPEIITPRVTGLLVQPGDEQALADACLELARNREWAGGVAARARRAVEDRFSHDRNGRAVAAVYHRRVLARAAEAHGTPRGARALWRGFARGLLAYGFRKVSVAGERRRMNRLRHDPAALTTALKSAQSVLIVCHGNIIRSAFAARLLAQALGHGSPVSVSSGGLAALPGRPPHPTAVLTANALRVDLSQHAAARVGPESVAAADVIFVMDVQQLATMRARFPDARAKTFLLTALAPGTPLEIRDPVNGDESRFQACFEHIVRAVQPIVRTLSDRAHAEPVAG